PAGSTWPVTLPVTWPVTCPAALPSWAKAGAAIAALPAARRMKVLRIENLLRLTGMQEQRTEAAACFIGRRGGARARCAHPAGKAALFQAVGARPAPPTRAADRRIFATKARA